MDLGTRPPSPEPQPQRAAQQLQQQQLAPLQPRPGSGAGQGPPAPAEALTPSPPAGDAVRVEEQQEDTEITVGGAGLQLVATVSGQDVRAGRVTVARPSPAWGSRAPPTALSPRAAAAYWGEQAAAAVLASPLQGSQGRGGGRAGGRGAGAGCAGHGMQPPVSADLFRRDPLVWERLEAAYAAQRGQVLTQDADGG